MNNDLNEEIKNHWNQLRGMTYDLLDLLLAEDLRKKLPFPASQDLLYQFNCMIGAQESNIPSITKGIWEGFTSSLDNEVEKDIKVIKRHMVEADKRLFDAIESIDLLKKFPDGRTPLINYMILVEHEAHHQGQAINFMYACNLPIPKSCEYKWALRK